MFTIISPPASGENVQLTTSNGLALNPARVFVKLITSPTWSWKARIPNDPEMVSCSRFWKRAILAMRCAVADDDTRPISKSIALSSPPSTSMNVDDLISGKSLNCQLLSCPLNVPRTMLKLSRRECRVWIVTFERRSSSSNATAGLT